jgi:hypothetical protein
VLAHHYKFGTNDYQKQAFSFTRKKVLLSEKSFEVVLIDVTELRSTHEDN